MPRIEWDRSGEKFYEYGVDRGVLYPRIVPKASYTTYDNGVPWNGLINVTQNVDGGDAKPHYIDGYKYMNVSTPKEFSGVIEAYTYPEEFGISVGDLTNGNGVLYGQQRSIEFGLTYRTKVGNDLSDESSYKIHLIYQALATPSDEVYSTQTNLIDPMSFSWNMTTRGVLTPGLAPTAELVIDSRSANPEKISLLEDILYGVGNKYPRLPSQSEVIDLFDDWPFYQIELNIITGITPIEYRGRKDIKGDVSRGIFSIPRGSTLNETNIPGLYYN